MMNEYERCPVCNKWFEPTKRKRYCTTACTRKAWWHKRKEQSRKGEKEVVVEIATRLLKGAKSRAV